MVLRQDTWYTGFVQITWTSCHVCNDVLNLQSFGNGGPKRPAFNGWPDFVCDTKPGIGLCLLFTDISFLQRSFCTLCWMKCTVYSYVIDSVDLTGCTDSAELYYSGTSVQYWSKIPQSHKLSGVSYSLLSWLMAQLDMEAEEFVFTVGGSSEPFLSKSL